MAYKRVKFSRCSSQSFEETGFLGLENNTGPKTNSGLVEAMFSRFVCDLARFSLRRRKLLLEDVSKNSS